MTAFSLRARPLVALASLIAATACGGKTDNAAGAKNGKKARRNKKTN